MPYFTHFGLFKQKNQAGREIHWYTKQGFPMPLVKVLGCHSHRVHLGSLHSPTRPQLLQARPRSLPRHGLPLEGNEELPTMLPTSPSASPSPPTLHHTLWDRNARGTTSQSWRTSPGWRTSTRPQGINCPSLTTPSSAPPGMLQVGGRGLELPNEAPRGFLSRFHSLPAHDHQSELLPPPRAPSPSLDPSCLDF